VRLIALPSPSPSPFLSSSFFLREIVMRRVLSLLALSFSVVAGLGGCAQARYAETAVGAAVDNPVTIEASWGEVSCGRGVICAEIEVLRVDAEERDGGRIDVLLHNRTGEARAVQVALEILTADGVKVDATNFQDIAVEARQERTFSMPGIHRKGHRIRVLLRQRAS
jgi:hypothetical protein